MAKKNLAQAAADLLNEVNAANLRPADTRTQGEPFGAGKHRDVEQPQKGGEDLGGSPVKTADNGIAAAIAAAPKAHPPKGPSVGQAPREDIHVGQHGKDRAKAHDDGTVTEEEEVKEEEKVDEEGHGQFQKVTTHKIKTLGEEDKEVSEEEDVKEEDEVKEETVDEEPALNKELDIKAMVSAMPVSDKVKSYVKEKGAGLAVEEDLKALFQGEKLSENFMKKARIIFETAVIEKATKVCEDLQQEYITVLEGAVKQIQESLDVKVNDYLDYMVEEWVKENEIAIEKGIRAELAEDFISGLKTLFEEHYVDIPADKVNVVEELTTSVQDLEKKVNEEIERGVALNKQLNEYKKIEVVRSVCEGLTETQFQKIKQLAENVTFSTSDEFTSSVKTLKESYFPKGATPDKSHQLDEESIEGDERGLVEEVHVDPEMQAAVAVLSRLKK